MRSLPAQSTAVQPMRALLELDSLSDWLWELDYGFHERLAILQSAQRHHSLQPAIAAGMVDREDAPILVAVLHEANACLGPPTDAELGRDWPGLGTP